jgi:hypothetical protein
MTTQGLIGIALVTAACGAATSSSVETTSAQVPLDKAQTVEAIVRAHCGHEDACTELTGVRRFHDDASCARAFREPALVSVKCDHDIASPNLTRCLDSIHTSGCNRRNAEIPACTTEALCR